MKLTLKQVLFALCLFCLPLIVLFATQPSAAAGDAAAIYKAKCAGCHGPDGKGETPAGKATKARDLCSEDVKKETDDEWASIIIKGKNKMPSYDKKLTDAEVKEVIAYMRSFCK